MQDSIPLPAAAYVLARDEWTGWYLVPVTLGADVRHGATTTVRLLAHDPDDD